LGTTRSNILNPFERRQSAIEGRDYVHSGELEAGKVPKNSGDLRFQFALQAAKIRRSYWVHFLLLGSTMKAGLGAEPANERPLIRPQTTFSRPSSEIQFERKLRRKNHFSKKICGKRQSM